MDQTDTQLSFFLFLYFLLFPISPLSLFFLFFFFPLPPFSYRGHDVHSFCTGHHLSTLLFFKCFFLRHIFCRRGMLSFNCMDWEEILFSPLLDGMME